MIILSIFLIGILIVFAIDSFVIIDFIKRKLNFSSDETIFYDFITIEDDHKRIITVSRSSILYAYLDDFPFDNERRYTIDIKCEDTNSTVRLYFDEFEDANRILNRIKNG